ncbi:MAG: right-handed parallel beta-helix repeat-containing protein [Bacteroidota bacterium]
MAYQFKILMFLFMCLLISFSYSQERYAIIITGESAGTDANENGSWISNSNNSTWDEFWNDTYLMWEMLVIDKGYDDENVFVIYADGEDYSYLEQNIRYKAENHIGYTQITDYPATKDNIETIFNGLAQGIGGFPLIEDDDFLFVYTFGHGDYTYGIDGTQHSVLTLMGYTWDTTHLIWDSDHSVADTELQSFLNSINCQKKVIVMQQCYSGGFLPYLENTNSIVFTATSNNMVARAADEKYYDDIDYPGDPNPGVMYLTDENESYDPYSHEYGHGEFNLHFLNSIRGETPNGLTDYSVPGYVDFALSSADLNFDSQISIYEVYEWVKDFDSWQRYYDPLWGGYDDIQWSDIEGISSTTTLEYPTIIIEDISTPVTYKGRIGIPIDVTITSGASINFLDNAEIFLLNGASLTIDNNSSIISGANCKFYSNGISNEIIINGQAQFGNSNKFYGNPDEGTNLNILLQSESSICYSSAYLSYVDLMGVVNYFELFNSELSSSLINISDGTIEIDHCEFINSNLHLNKSISNVRRVDIKNSTFHSYDECPVYIKSYDDYFIDSCTIENNGGDGMQIHYSGHGVAARNIRDCIIQNNGTIETTTAAGIRIYSSNAEISTNNYISGNPYGIQCLDQSNVIIRGNSFAQYVNETQNITYNDINQVYATHYSFPPYFHYNAVFYNNNPYPLVYHDIISGTNPDEDVRANYWSTDFDPLVDLFGGKYVWEPIWQLTSGGEIETYADERMYNNASLQIADTNFNEASDSLILLVETFPDSTYAHSALKLMFAMESEAGGDYTDLLMYYRTNTTIQSNVSLKKTADFLIAMCEIEREYYSYAIDYFDSIILNPETYEDSLFAIIDLAYTYDRMGDTLLKSSYQGLFPQYKFSCTDDYNRNMEFHIDLLFKNHLENTHPNDDLFFDEVEYGSVKVFPNPSSQYVNIEVIAGSDQIGELCIYNTFGRMYFKKDMIPLSGSVANIMVNISEFPPGVYCYQLKFDNGSMKSGKFVKQ